MTEEKKLAAEAAEEFVKECNQIGKKARAIGMDALEIVEKTCYNSPEFKQNFLDHVISSAIHNQKSFEAIKALFFNKRHMRKNGELTQIFKNFPDIENTRIKLLNSVYDNEKNEYSKALAAEKYREYNSNEHIQKNIDCIIDSANAESVLELASVFGISFHTWDLLVLIAKAAFLEGVNATKQIYKEQH